MYFMKTANKIPVYGTIAFYVQI